VPVAVRCRRVRLTFYTHHYDGTGDEPCGARGTVTEPAVQRPGYFTLDGVRVSDAPCGLPRMLHDQGALAHHAAAPRAVRIDEVDLRRWRRPGAAMGHRVQEARADPPRQASRRSRGGHSASNGGPDSRSYDVRVLVPRELLDRIAYRGGTELVTDHARRLLRTVSEHPWPLLVVGDRDALVEVAQPREALQLLGARQSQRARLTAARRSVAERLAAALTRAAQSEDLEERSRILVDAVAAAAVRLESAEAVAVRPQSKPRPRGPIHVVTGALPPALRRK